MSRTRYDVSPWLDRVAKSRRPTYPRLRGHQEADVVVVGGGIVGCLTAHAVAGMGASVVLVEAGAIGEASTAHGPGLALIEPQVDFKQAVGGLGLRPTKRIWQASRRGTRELAASIKRHGIRCDLATLDQIEIALQEAHESRSSTGFKARKDAGFPVTRLTRKVARERTGIAAAGAIKVPGGLTLDPYLACLGMARVAVRRGARLFERSEVLRIEHIGPAVGVRTRNGTVEAPTVVIATGQPSPLFKPLHRYVTSMDTYGVMTAVLPAPSRRDVGRRDAILRDSETPPRYVRWTRDHRIVITGADQPSPPARSRPRTLVQRTGQLMYELSTLYPVISGLEPAYGWSASYGQTRDGLPIVGPHRNYPRHLFALGFAHGGLGMAFLASRILARAIAGEPAKDDEPFGFGRLR